jgi:hypothetical protein
MPNSFFEPMAALVAQKLSCEQNGPQKEVLSFKIDPPADGTIAARSHPWAFRHTPDSSAIT